MKELENYMLIKDIGEDEPEPTRIRVTITFTQDIEVRPGEDIDAKVDETMDSLLIEDEGRFCSDYDWNYIN